MKSAWKTTEFWATVLALAGGVAAAATAPISAPVAAVGAGIAAGFYALSRGLAKLRGDK